jgi:hypothetical protein
VNIPPGDFLIRVGGSLSQRTFDRAGIVLMINIKNYIILFINGIRSNLGQSRQGVKNCFHFFGGAGQAFCAINVPKQKNG